MNDPTTADSDSSIEIQVVGAIRLALEGAADDETLLRLVQWLIEQAPATPPSDTDSVRLFIEGIRGIGGSVSTASPSGNYVPTYVLSGEGTMWTLPMVLDELCRILAEEVPDA